MAFIESEFDLDSDLIEFEIKEDKNTKKILEELRAIDDSNFEKGDKFYELHHQCFVINMDWWKNNGRN